MNFLQLSTNTQLAIFEYLNLSDLLNLRLCCKELGGERTGGILTKEGKVDQFCNSHIDNLSNKNKNLPNFLHNKKIETIEPQTKGRFITTMAEIEEIRHEPKQAKIVSSSKPPTNSQHQLKKNSKISSNKLETEDMNAHKEPVSILIEENDLKKSSNIKIQEPRKKPKFETNQIYMNKQEHNIPLDESNPPIDPLMVKRKWKLLSFKSIAVALILIVEAASLTFAIIALCASLHYSIGILGALQQVTVLGSSAWLVCAVGLIALTGYAIHCSRYPARWLC